MLAGTIRLATIDKNVSAVLDANAVALIRRGALVDNQVPEHQMVW